MSVDFWRTKVRITCEEKHGKCRYQLGDSYIYDQPHHSPKDMCLGIQEPARIPVIHCAMGLPSWEGDDKSIYRIHCISKKGTVWRIERIPPET